MTKLEILEMLAELLFMNRVWLPDDYGSGDYVVSYDHLMSDLHRQIRIAKQENEGEDNA